jgi:hypothetical protein
MFYEVRLFRRTARAGLYDAALARARAAAALPEARAPIPADPQSPSRSDFPPELAGSAHRI